MIDNSIGGHVGGPIIKNKLFWHVDYERNNQDGQQFTSVPAFPQFTGNFAVPLDEDLFGAATRLEHQEQRSRFLSF